MKINGWDNKLQELLKSIAPGAYCRPYSGSVPPICIHKFVGYKNETGIEEKEKE
jgi:hypothetical protein